MKSVTWAPVLAATLMTLWCGAAQGQQQRDPYYRITSQGTGGATSLDVGEIYQPGSYVPMMAPTGTAQGQFWYVVQARNGDIRFTNAWNGQSMCLDVAGDSSLYMDNCGPQIGQRWKYQVVSPRVVVITNQYKPGECLDTRPGPLNMRQPYLTRCNGSANQRWNLVNTNVYP